MNMDNINRVRNLVREWFGALSVEEIMSNHELVEIFKKIERSLQEIEYGNQTWRQNERKAY